MRIAKLWWSFFVFFFTCFLKVINVISWIYECKITLHNVTRLCQTKSIISVNGRFPGPPVVAREGDRVVVKVDNKVSNNVTIHWYGSVHQI